MAGVPKFQRECRTAEPSLQNSAAPCNLISMPELPDITAYIRALEKRDCRPTAGARAPGQSFSAADGQPPLACADGRKVRSLRRIGKRIAIGVEGDFWLVLHLMIAGRLHWKTARRKAGGPSEPGSFRFSQRLPLLLPKPAASAERRLHVVSGEENLASFDAGGIDVFACRSGFVSNAS